MPISYSRVMVTEEEIRAWKATTWIVYVHDSKLKKKLLVMAGERLYRFFHGDELIYEGDKASVAARKFNLVTQPPKENDKPKTSN